MCAHSHGGIVTEKGVKDAVLRPLVLDMPALNLMRSAMHMLVSPLFGYQMVPALKTQTEKDRQAGGGTSGGSKKTYFEREFVPGTHVVRNEFRDPEFLRALADASAGTGTGDSGSASGAARQGLLMLVLQLCIMSDGRTISGGWVTGARSGQRDAALHCSVAAGVARCPRVQHARLRTVLTPAHALTAAALLRPRGRAESDLFAHLKSLDPSLEEKGAAGGGELGAKWTEIISKDFVAAK
jgi:hypothetical protein